MRDEHPELPAVSPGLPANEGPAHLNGCVTEGGITTCADYCPRFAAVRYACRPGATYGRPTPMPAPTVEPVEGREPDAYGVAVGDLIAGTCVTIGCSTVGEVIEILPRVPFAGMDGNRYRVRVGDVYATGGVIERIVHDHPGVIVPAGNPVVCATCEGEHESARRFVDCQIAHVRAEREAAATQEQSYIARVAARYHNAAAEALGGSAVSA